MLDEMSQRNTSKFAMFFEYKYPSSFLIFHFVQLYLRTCSIVMRLRPILTLVYIIYVGSVFIK